MFNLLSQAVSAEAANEAVGLVFTTEHIGEALLCSGAGMLGIFIVVGIIVGSVSVLNKVGSPKKK